MAVNRAIINGYQQDPPGNYAVLVSFIDGTTNLAVDNELIDLNLSGVVDPVTLNTVAVAAIASFVSMAGYTLTETIQPFALNLPAPASYQTIVSQTGTTAPAVSGAFSPMSTYPSGSTFSWARTGVGVYTLTASTAIFNTSGKTGVFVAPLANLNASVRAVVTSSTVITITTAVQSVAVLGLLGLTAAATDALLSGTMIYIQTYA